MLVECTTDYENFSEGQRVNFVTVKKGYYLGDTFVKYSSIPRTYFTPKESFKEGEKVLIFSYTRYIWEVGTIIRPSSLWEYKVNMACGTEATKIGASIKKLNKRWR